MWGWYIGRVCECIRVGCGGVNVSVFVWGWVNVSVFVWGVGGECICLGVVG